MGFLRLRTKPTNRCRCEECPYGPEKGFVPQDPLAEAQCGIAQTADDGSFVPGMVNAVTGDHESCPRYQAYISKNPAAA